MFQNRYKGVYNPDAYTRLLLEALRGNQSAFVRSDELLAAWEIFSPILKEIDSKCEEARKNGGDGGKFRPIPYIYGSRGPNEAEAFIASKGMVRTAGYVWQPPAK